MNIFPKTTCQPKANSNAIVCKGPVRFTVLTSRLIRLEYDPATTFEDRPTQLVWNRELPSPKFTKTITDEEVIIETEFLRLKYKLQDFGFYHEYLQIELIDRQITWKFGDKNNTNLGGTVRTLDRVDGSIPLNPGLISRNGWSVVDDSDSLVFRRDGWLENRQAHPEAKDLYFFGYGKDYTQCLIDFQRISGQVPILPRFALGNWWSRYWAYHQDELITLVKEFHDRRIPLSVCIVDMDWHIVDTGNESSGWTGYTWNHNLFPDPVQFIAELKALNLATALNLHPADGVYPHEAKYEAMAKRMGIDPESKQPVKFQISDPKFVKSYFEILHHPLEAMGIDFWWLDWQQGTETTLKGMDPLFWLNHLHFYDRAKNNEKRPFIFSRWGGLGSHRYPIGFSGDTYVTWETLHFQPYFTSTAANVAYGWWSHDIGGHMGGVEEPELYLRWVQLGVFSPILRLHSTNNPFHERRPWGYDAETTIHAKSAFRLRHALIPYLYTAAWKNHKEGIPLVRPMYHLYPEVNDAYLCENEYTFGSELIANPFTTPTDKDTRMSRQVVWLPEGRWFDYFSGDSYKGGGWYALYGSLERIPVFAKAGAIVPLDAATHWHTKGLPDALTIQLFPGANNQFSLYEDDGETQAYKQGAFAITNMTQTWGNKFARFEIRQAEGHLFSLPKNRIYKLIYFAINKPESVRLNIDGKEVPVDDNYDQNAHKLILTDIILPPFSELTLEVTSSENLLFIADHTKIILLQMLEIFKMDSFIKQTLHQKLDEFITNPHMLGTYADRMEDSHILAMIETWLGKQSQKFSEDTAQAFQSILNMLYHS